MELENVESPKSQVIFAFLEYLQDLKKDSKLSEDAIESVEVATQCLSSAFEVDLNDEDARKKYSIKPHSLSTVIGLGLAGKDKLAQALDKIHQRSGTVEGNDVESKFYQYIQTLKKKGFFNGVVPATAEYEQRYTRAREKFFEKFKKPESQTASTTSTTSTTTTSTSNVTPMETEPTPSVTKPTVNVENLSSTERNEKAEKYKMEGNQKLTEKKYKEAVDCYTMAIQFNSENAIYYANRAAAYSHLGLHEKAIEDCNKSIAQNPNYSKAYGRLGLAYFSLGKYSEAVNAYRKGLELEPGSQSLKESLSAAEKKVNEISGNAPANTSNATPTQPQQQQQAPNLGGFDLNGIMNNPQIMNMFGNLMGGGQPPTTANTGNATSDQSRPAGGPGGLNLNELLNNPMLQSMASQMMNNPAMMSMAQNLMQNPEALNGVLRQFGVDGNQENNNQQ